MALPSLAILTYHSLDTSGSCLSVSPRQFADHMASLRELGYRGLSLREAVAHREARGHWPERAVVLTFDDGYANVHEHAGPILARLGFTATVFVVTGHMGRLNDWAPPPRGLGRQPILSWPQAAALSRNGLEIGAHSQTHRDLTRLPAADVARELAGSRADVEGHLGEAARSFAYPFGALSAAVLAVSASCFRAACTTDLRRARGEPLHRLPRVDAFYLRGLRSLEGLLSGRLDPYLRIRRWGRALRGAVSA